MNRRTFLERGAAAAAATLAIRCGGGGRDVPRLRVMLNGGIYEELARKLVGPFERQTGARVELVPGSAAEIITRLRAEQAAPSVDVAIIDRLVAGTSLDDSTFRPSPRCCTRR